MWLKLTEDVVQGLQFRIPVAVTDVNIVVQLYIKHGEGSDFTVTTQEISSCLTKTWAPISVTIWANLAVGVMVPEDLAVCTVEESNVPSR